jgi:ATP-binding cassette subfamily B protein
VMLTGLTALQSALPVVSALLLGKLVDGLAAGPNPDLWPLVALWGATLLAVVPAGALTTYGIDIFTQRVQAHVSDLVAAKAATLDLASIEQPSIQDQVFRAHDDATRRLPSLLTAILTGVSGLLTVVALVVALMFIDPAVALLLLLPLLLAVPAAAGWHRVEDWQRQRVLLIRTLRYLQRLMTEPRIGAEVRALHVATTLILRSAGMWREVLGLQVRIARWTCRAEVITSGAFVLGVIAGTTHAVSQAFTGAVSVGGVVMLVQLQQRTFAAAQRLQRTLAQLAAYGTDFHVLRQFLDLPAPESAAGTLSGPKPLTRGLRLEAVSFQYPATDAPAVQEVSVTIAPGTTVAIVGPNGSGKTTLLKLLCRLYTPTTGRILWDGVEIDHFDLANWRSAVAITFQDAARFELTAYDNIAFGSPAPVTRDAVQRAADLAGAKDIIAKLPQGLDTPLGSLHRGSVELSGGQWQALALARGLLRDAPLLLLDEPNHNLDPEAEAVLFERLREYLAGRTAVIVSHRFSAARFADTIIVMDGGRVVEQGTHDALLKQQGVYARLFLTQAHGYR